MKNNTQNNVSAKVFDGVGNLGQLLCKVGSFGVSRINLFKKDFWIFFTYFVGIVFCITYEHQYLFWIYRFWPWLFSEGYLSFLARPSWGFHFLLFFTFGGAFVLMLMGIGPYRTQRHYQRKLNEVNLKSGLGTVPKVLSVIKSEWKIKLLIDSKGIGKNKYKAKKEDLSASFGFLIESIKEGWSPRYIELSLTARMLPKRISYFERMGHLEKPVSFLVGESLGGPVVCEMDSLPHLLIAGSTGGGKSVFFKQALLGLLQSSEHLQMYLLDLKGGLEMRDFQALPNVQVVKDEKQAVHLLERIRDEMKSRFAFLESKGHKSIVPQRDKMDKMIVGIDEASELYTRVQRGNDKSKWILRARELTDELAKLSRAAGIHLIFATQKINKDTIDPKVQENMGGRICFKTNTLENSLRALGNKMAYDLPDIKGRGVWSKGSEFLEIQGPFLSDEDLKEEIGGLVKSYKDKEKRFFGPMLNLTGTEKAQNKDELSKRDTLKKS